MENTSSNQGGDTEVAGVLDAVAVWVELGEDVAELALVDEEVA